MQRAVSGAVRTLDRASRLLQSRGDQNAAADIIVRLGRLWSREPGEGLQTAALRFRQALMLRPGHSGALYGLTDIAIAEGDLSRARQSLEELLRALDEGRADVERQELFIRLGEVLDKSGDPTRAVMYFQKALDGDVFHADSALNALEDIHTRAERWDDVGRVLEVALQRFPSAEGSTQRITRLVDVLVNHQDAVERGIELLETVLDSSPELEHLERLVGLYRQTERREKLADALLAWSKLLDEPKTVASLLTERGDLLRIYLNDTNGAIQAFTEALGCDPECRPAISGLLEVYRERERFPELARLLERAIPLEPELEAGRLGLELDAYKAKFRSSQ